jgi:hypothetical protein
VVKKKKTDLDAIEKELGEGERMEGEVTESPPSSSRWFFFGET